MRLRSWFFLSLGIVLAVITGVALNGVAQQNADRVAAAPPQTVSIIVAKSDIPARAVLTAAMLAHRDYPKELVPKALSPTRRTPSDKPRSRRSRAERRSFADRSSPRTARPARR